MKIKVFYRIEPCLKEDNGFGLHRDRTPDAGWGELRNTIISEAKEVEMTPELKKILIEDVAYWTGSNSEKFSEIMTKLELW